MPKQKKSAETEKPIEEKMEEVGQKIEERAEEFGQKMEEKFKHHEGGGNFIWAFFLIFLGTMFLLNTTGVVSWDVWSYLWRFWPIFLILAGAQIIFGHSRFTSFLVGIIALLCFIFIGLTAIASVNSTLLQNWGISLPN